MTWARSIRVAAVVCALGAAVVLLGASLPWARFGAPVDPLAGGGPNAIDASFPAREVGQDSVPVLGLAALAGAAVLLALAGAARRLVAASLLLVGGTVVVLALHFRTDATLSDVDMGALGRKVGVPISLSDPKLRTGPGPVVSAVGGGLLGAGAVLAILAPRGGAMGRRFDAPTGGARTAQALPAADPDGIDAWNAIDRGEDPTEGFTGA